MALFMVLKLFSYQTATHPQTQGGGGVGWGEDSGWGELEETLGNSCIPWSYIQTHPQASSVPHWFRSLFFSSQPSSYPLLSSLLYNILPLHIRHGLPWCHQLCHSSSTGNHFSFVPHTFLVFLAIPPPTQPNLEGQCYLNSSRQNCSLVSLWQCIRRSRGQMLK